MFPRMCGKINCDRPERPSNMVSKRQGSIHNIRSTISHKNYFPANRQARFAASLELDESAGCSLSPDVNEEPTRCSKGPLKERTRRS